MNIFLRKAHRGQWLESAKYLTMNLAQYQTLLHTLILQVRDYIFVCSFLDDESEAWKGDATDKQFMPC